MDENPFFSGALWGEDTVVPSEQALAKTVAPPPRPPRPPRAAAPQSNPPPAPVRRARAAAGRGSARARVNALAQVLASAHDTTDPLPECLAQCRRAASDAEAAQRDLDARAAALADALAAGAWTTPAELELLPLAGDPPRICSVHYQVLEVPRPARVRRAAPTQLWRAELGAASPTAPVCKWYEEVARLLGSRLDVGCTIGAPHPHCPRHDAAAPACGAGAASNSPPSLGRLFASAATHGLRTGVLCAFAGAEGCLAATVASAAFRSSSSAGVSPWPDLHSGIYGGGSPPPCKPGHAVVAFPGEHNGSFIEAEVPLEDCLVPHDVRSVSPECSLHFLHASRGSVPLALVRILAATRRAATFSCNAACGSVQGALLSPSHPALQVPSTTLAELAALRGSDDARSSYGSAGVSFAATFAQAALKATSAGGSAAAPSASVLHLERPWNADEDAPPPRLPRPLELHRWGSPNGSVASTIAALAGTLEGSLLSPSWQQQQQHARMGGSGGSSGGGSGGGALWSLTSGQPHQQLPWEAELAPSFSATRWRRTHWTLEEQRALSDAHLFLTGGANELAGRAVGWLAHWPLALAELERERLARAAEAAAATTALVGGGIVGGGDHDAVMGDGAGGIGGEGLGVAAAAGVGGGNVAEAVATATAPAAEAGAVAGAQPPLALKEARGGGVLLAFEPAGPLPADNKDDAAAGASVASRSVGDSGVVHAAVAAAPVTAPPSSKPTGGGGGGGGDPIAPVRAEALSLLMCRSKSAQQITVLHYRAAPLRAAVSAAALVGAGTVVLAPPPAHLAGVGGMGGGAGAGVALPPPSLAAAASAAILQCDWGGLEHFMEAMKLHGLAPPPEAVGLVMVVED